MTTPSSAGARCSFSRKTLLAVAAVSAAGAAVAAAYAKGRKKKRKTSGDMTSSSSSTTLSEEQCNKSWSEQIEAEEDTKSVKEEEKLSTKLGELKVGRSSGSAMSRDAKKPVSVNCPDDDAPLAKATDSGVVSPVGGDGDNEFVSKKQRSESSDSGGSSGSVGSLIAGSSSSSSVHNHLNQHLTQHNGDGAFSDSGQGSEPDDGTIMCYQFKIPSHMTGKLIGLGGQFVKSLKSMTMCHIDIEKNFNRDISRSSRNGQRNWLPPQDGQPKDYQTVMLEGTRSQIDKCLDLVRERFHNNPEVSLEQTNGSMVPSLHGAPNHFPTPQHALMSSNVLPVFVSALESGTHIFVQQPTHYTFHHVYRLEECMNHVYDGANNGKQHGGGDCSLSEAELQEALVCVCRSDGKWYRIQLVSKAADDVTDDEKSDEKRSGKWCCRFLDVGGYGWVEPKDLRKIRSDFLELPFQAIECCLANVVPRESVDEFSGAEALRDLTQNKNCFVRLSHFEEGSVPSVDLYYQTDETNEDSRHVLVNRELVNLGLMNWFEAATETATVNAGSATGAAEATDAPLVWWPCCPQETLASCVPQLEDGSWEIQE